MERERERERERSPLMKRERAVGANIGKGGGGSKAHREGVVRMMRKELFESFLRKLRLRAAIVRRRTVELLRWVSKSLVKYCQHGLSSSFFFLHEEIKRKLIKMIEFLRR